MNLANFPNRRDTFGILDPLTGKPYTDILSSFLEQAFFSKEFLEIEGIVKTGVKYTLHIDTKLRNALKALENSESVQVIISFQKRTDMNIALARVYNSKKTSIYENP